MFEDNVPFEEGSTNKPNSFHFSPEKLDAIDAVKGSLERLSFLPEAIALHDAMMSLNITEFEVEEIEGTESGAYYSYWDVCCLTLEKTAVKASGLGDMVAALQTAMPSAQFEEDAFIDVGELIEFMESPEFYCEAWRGMCSDFGGLTRNVNHLNESNTFTQDALKQFVNSVLQDDMASVSQLFGVSKAS